MNKHQHEIPICEDRIAYKAITALWVKKIEFQSGNFLDYPEANALLSVWGCGRLLLEDLASPRPSHTWGILEALRAVYGDASPNIPPEHLGRLQEVVNIWIAWGKKNGLIDP
jgi:hypothetical protein